MASPIPAINHRAPPNSARSHVQNTVTAIQGATAAFTVTPSQDGRPATGQKPGTTTHHAGYSRPQPASHPDSESEPAPEVGSVKDKIGLFASNSHLNDSRGNSRPSTPGTTEQIAARFALGSSQAEKIAASVAKDAAQERGKPRPPPNDSHLDRVSPSPEPMQDREITKVGPIAISSSNGEKVPLRHKPPPRKPSPKSLADATQIASKKPRPVPPIPRKERPLPNTPTPASSTPINNRADEPRGPAKDPPSQSGVVPLKDVSVPPEEKAPALPPRPPILSTPKVDVRSHRHLLNESGSNQSTSPSSGSPYRQPRSNLSSTSLSGESRVMDEETLSDAIVASSLAARHSQARKVPPAPPPQRRPGARPILQLQAPGQRDRSTPISPAGSLRQTLRSDGLDEENDEHSHHHHHHHKPHFIHKHPHRHHEGDRKKWRGEVTEKERKRYEGVWAANKGLLIPAKEQMNSSDRYPPDASEMVANVIVRDIWSRSRLPRRTLQEIWDLVDRQDIGLLTREEFVVGMWLIDQQLKGHKLPSTVPASIWDSVRDPSGINLRKLPPRLR
ncbi:hypothetical protein P168DRAFT_319068 [Aspergillus campestris IBT 28561]|uniref:EH domain-containing protein n=1 Tax=Aspergillus campestris (strain IBT 28561) TaxID=1392248 RepID=A0A2I1D152_ASPC2|nr:uncharacterized protein P168DRAFT_319068 [Aspergillus campestris IBT 28561]PKY03603.1 hypothetical protein P168DRAFT_319068 [Aspergillus campestris IBT 28561]